MKKYTDVQYFPYWKGTKLSQKETSQEEFFALQPNNPIASGGLWITH